MAKRKTKYKPKKINGKKIDEHRLIMEKHLRRRLFPHEIVHHIDGDKSNNNINNLILFPTKSAHTKYHFKNGDLKLKAGINKKKLIKGKLKCNKCEELKYLDDFKKDPKCYLGIRGICKKCYGIQRKMVKSK